MKKQIERTLLMGTLSLVLLTACGEAPGSGGTGEETTKVREVTDSESAEIEADLALCRAAVEEVQSCEFLEIVEEKQNRGEDTLNDTSEISFVKGGEDCYRCVSIPIDSYLDDVPVFSRDQRTLYKDGAYFNDYYNGYTTTDEYGEHTHWGASTMSDRDNALSARAPWLLTFDWDAQEVQYISTLHVGEQKAIRVQILGEYLPDTICESYTAEFYFDQEEQLDRVELVASYALPPRAGIPEKTGPAMDETSTQKVVSTDADRIKKEIASAYEQALEDVHNKPADEEEMEISGNLMA